MLVNLSLYATTDAPCHRVDRRTTGENLLGDRLEHSREVQDGMSPLSIYSQNHGYFSALFYME